MIKEMWARLMMRLERRLGWIVTARGSSLDRIVMVVGIKRVGSESDQKLRIRAIRAMERLR